MKYFMINVCFLNIAVCVFENTCRLTFATITYTLRYHRPAVRSSENWAAVNFQMPDIKPCHLGRDQDIREKQNVVGIDNLLVVRLLCVFISLIALQVPEAALAANLAWSRLAKVNRRGCKLSDQQASCPSLKSHLVVIDYIIWKIEHLRSRLQVKVMYAYSLRKDSG